MACKWVTLMIGGQRGFFVVLCTLYFRSMHETFRWTFPAATKMWLIVYKWWIWKFSNVVHRHNEVMTVETVKWGRDSDSFVAREVAERWAERKAKVLRCTRPKRGSAFSLFLSSLPCEIVRFSFSGLSLTSRFYCCWLKAPVIYVRGIHSPPSATRDVAGERKRAKHLINNLFLLPPQLYVTVAFRRELVISVAIRLLTSSQMVLS